MFHCTLTILQKLKVWFCFKEKINGKWPDLCSRNDQIFLRFKVFVYHKYFFSLKVLRETKPWQRSSREGCWGAETKQNSIKFFDTKNLEVIFCWLKFWWVMALLTERPLLGPGFRRLTDETLIFTTTTTTTNFLIMQNKLEVTLHNLDVYLERCSLSISKTVVYITFSHSI